MRSMALVALRAIGGAGLAGMSVFMAFLLHWLVSSCVVAQHGSSRPVPAPPVTRRGSSGFPAHSESNL
jgi:hypothetical protein